MLTITKLLYNSKLCIILTWFCKSMGNIMREEAV